MGQVAELLANPPVEVRAGKLSQVADALAEANRQLVAARQLAHGVTIQDDVKGVPARPVDDVEDVVGRDDERPGGERVRAR